ncbi:MAG TPA: hypothetical protein VEV87_00330, partial [Chitinophagaceae bacterium]|nr:hypothetical protein [Chitinophagaceae bacterium]
LQYSIFKWTNIGSRPQTTVHRPQEEFLKLKVNDGGETTDKQITPIKVEANLLDGFWMYNSNLPGSILS